MTTDIVGPASAVDSTTVRPSDGRQWTTTDTWFVDCSTPNSDDGTDISAAWLNGVTGLLRNIIRGNGLEADGATPVVPYDQSDNMALNAIAALFQRARAIYAVDTGTPGSIVAALSFAPAEILPGMKFRVRLANNITGATNITLNGLGPFQVTTPHGSALANLDYLAGDTVEMMVAVIAGALVFGCVSPIHYAEIRTALTFKVYGAGADFADLNAAAAWVIRRRIALSGSVLFQLPAGQMSQTGTANSIVWPSHPDGDRITIAGAALLASYNTYLGGWVATGGSPAQRTSDAANNLTYARTKFATELRLLQGATATFTGKSPQFKNILFTGDGTVADGVLFLNGTGVSITNCVFGVFGARGLLIYACTYALTNVLSFGCGSYGLQVSEGAQGGVYTGLGVYGCAADNILVGNGCLLDGLNPGGPIYSGGSAGSGVHSIGGQVLSAPGGASNNNTVVGWWGQGAVFDVANTSSVGCATAYQSQRGTRMNAQNTAGSGTSNSFYADELSSISRSGTTVTGAMSPTTLGTAGNNGAIIF